MGNEVRPRALHGRAWPFVHLVSRVLKPAERDAVCGDFAESEIGSLHALRDLIGLVVRRQAWLWCDWRPWFVLTAIVAPLGFLLSHAARSWADSRAIYAYMYVNHWTFAFLESPGARRDLFAFAGYAVWGAVALVGWSWASGFALGALSRRTAWVTFSLFGLIVFLGTAGSMTMARANPFNEAAPFSVPFYGVVFPRLARLLLVIFPAWLGLRRSVERRALALVPALAGAGMIVMLTTWRATGLATSIVRDRNLVLVGSDRGGFIASDWIPMLPWLVYCVILWPVASIVFVAARQRCDKGTASAQELV